MEVTGKSKTGEAGRKALFARADARASRPALIVAELRCGAGELHQCGIPTSYRHLAPTAQGKNCEAVQE
jgi:hypothetical protein